MAFDNEEVATRARNLLTEQSESAVQLALPSIIAKIPTALENWSRSCFEDCHKRELFKKAFKATLTNGVLDLTAYLDGTSGRINLKELRETTLYSQAAEGEEDPAEATDGTATETDTDDMLPFVWVSSIAQLLYDRPLALDCPACYLDGSYLRTRDKTGSFISSDTVRFKVASFPAAVAEIPFTLQHDFITFLAQMLAQEAGNNGGS
jgi:hypothetical protein